MSADPRLPAGAADPAPPAPPVRAETGRDVADAPGAANDLDRDTGLSRAFEDKVFIGLLLAVTAAFFFILTPFYSAVFWGVVLAILFAPLHRWLLRRMPGRRNRVALLTLAMILVLVILPLSIVATSLVREALTVFQLVQSGQWNVAVYFDRILAALPAWASELLHRAGLGSVQELQDQVSAASKVIATHAVGFGQNTFDFVVNFGIATYLAFFLLRDGPELAQRIGVAVPLQARYKRRLLEKFTTVVRATIKGNIAVAVAHGVLGGLAFWVLGIHGVLLWTALMAFLSLLPAIGAALVWGPVALYLMATGQLWHGLGLVAYGALIMGSVDNVLRPLLVGKDTKMPDYVVLISTLGGLAVFGINGFVIGPVIAAMFIAAWDIFAREHGGEGF